MQVVIFNSKLEGFIRGLEKPTIAKALRMIDLLEKFAHRLGMPHSRAVGHGIFELRIRGVQEVRILYTFRNDRIVLLHGYIKKSTSMPAKELQQAARNAQGLDGV